MTTETKTEMVVFGGIAALAVFLWLSQRRPTGNSPLDFLSLGGNAAGGQAPAGAPLFDVAPVSPGSFSINMPGVSLPGGNGVYDAGQPSSCSCSGNLAPNIFGSTADLEAFLAQDPNFVSNAAAALSDWV